MVISCEISSDPSGQVRQDYVHMVDEQFMLIDAKSKCALAAVYCVRSQVGKSKYPPNGRAG